MTKDSGFVSFGEKEAEGNLIAFCSFLRRGSGEGGAELFSLLFSDRTRGRGSKRHQGRFRLGVKKHFFSQGG